jgi:hypothetical protein
VQREANNKEFVIKELEKQLEDAKDNQSKSQKVIEDNKESKFSIIRF